MVEDVKIVVAWKEQTPYWGDGNLLRHDRRVGYMVPYIHQKTTKLQQLRFVFHYVRKTNKPPIPPKRQTTAWEKISTCQEIRVENL